MIIFLNYTQSSSHCPLEAFLMCPSIQWRHYRGLPLRGYGLNDIIVISKSLHNLVDAMYRKESLYSSSKASPKYDSYFLLPLQNDYNLLKQLTKEPKEMMMTHPRGFVSTFELKRMHQYFIYMINT